MRIPGGDSTGRQISARSTKCPTQPGPEIFVGAHPVLRRRVRWVGNHVDLYRTRWVLSGPAPHRSLDIDEEKQCGMLEHFDHAAFEISGYRTLSL